MELRALQRGRDEADYEAWVRARFIAHTIYLHIPVFAKGVRKERDPRKFFPLPGDREAEERRLRNHKLTIVKVTKKQMAALDNLFAKIGK